jgi:hypothetical protein
MKNAKKAVKKAETKKDSVLLTAGESKVGEKYLTMKGLPIVVKSKNGKIIVTAQATGNDIEVKADYPLHVFEKESVSRDALLLMGAEGSSVSDAKVIAKRIARAKKIGKKTLSKEFNGKKYQVTVEDDGFQFKGDLFRSLTAVAKLVTGKKQIDGPAFWGVSSRG